MNESSTQAAGGLGRFDRWFSLLEDFLNLFAAFAIFVLMLVGVGQIVGRTVFNIAIYGYIDYIEQCTAIFAFLGVAYCQRFGTHIRMELLLHVLPKRALWIVESLSIVIAMVVITLLIEGSWFNFLRAYNIGDSTMDIQLPIWPGKLAVPVALTTLWIRLLMQLVGYVRLALNPGLEPVGVPTVHRPEEVAKAEIEDTLGRTERGQV
jgi:TRAP-type C4-dicarboxylate transport system permease small subunit